MSKNAFACLSGPGAGRRIQSSIQSNNRMQSKYTTFIRGEHNAQRSLRHGRSHVRKRRSIRRSTHRLQNYL